MERMTVDVISFTCQKVPVLEKVLRAQNQVPVIDVRAENGTFTDGVRFIVMNMSQHYKPFIK